MDKVRYESVDLMKGISILIVVVFHLKLPYLYSPYMTLFMLPSFFFFSGFFFSKSVSFKTFFVKKTNGLLVPYIFFSLTNILVTIGFYLKNISGGLQNAYYSSIALHNGPILFLLCLYFMSFIYYGICYIKNEWIKMLVLLIFSFVGYLLGKYNIRLPLTIDVAFSSVVFYHCGYLFRNNNMLGGNRKKVFVKWVSTLGVFIILTLLLHPVPELELANNDIPMAFYYYILAGISGTLMVAYFSILVNKIGIINYWGRYSIIILGTHWMLIRVWGYFLPYSIMINPFVLWGVLVFVLVFSYPIIKLCVTYFPKFCGQKPFFKV